MAESIREPTFLILAALAPKPVHGYAIISAVSTLSGGRVVLRPGTLYGALDRLADLGLVERDHDEVSTGRMRRYYRLSDAGVQALTQETERLRANAAAASRQLKLRSATRQWKPSRLAGGSA